MMERELTLELSDRRARLNCRERQLGLGRGGIGLQKPGQQQRSGRDTLTRAKPAASGRQQKQTPAQGQPQKIAI